MTQHYKTVKTSEEVFSAIEEYHLEHLVQFVHDIKSTGPESSVVWARRFSWGFPGATIPLIEMNIIRNREDEEVSRVTYTYYLCYPIEDNDS